MSIGVVTSMVETSFDELFTKAVYQPGSGLQGLMEAITSINAHCLTVLDSINYFSESADFVISQN